MIDMKKIPVILILMTLPVLFISCSKNEPVTERTTSDYVYHSSVMTTGAYEEEIATGESTTEETSAAETTTDGAAAETVSDLSGYVTVIVSDTTGNPAPSVPASVQPVPPQTTPVQPASTTAAPVHTTAYPVESEVDLSINMPQSNGKMKVIKSPSDKYIDKVSSDKGIDASRLCAVVTVPENGQNYVFEFSSASGRGVNDLKKVYLLDSYCNILNVASSDASQRVNLSTTENWFCMNVLIKGVVFPAIKDQF